MTAPLDPFKVHVADQVLAALAGDQTLSTPTIQDLTGYGPRYGQLVYTVLCRLAAAGEVEKIAPPGTKPVYWRRLTPAICLPPVTVRGNQDKGRPS